MAAADYIQVAQQLYLAYFGRPADRSGLINITAALEASGAPTDAQGIADAYAHKSNATVVAILNNFGSSAESQALYGNGSNAAFINAVYKQVLNRSPDLDGLDFWTAALANGTITRANAATQIIAAALKDGGDATDALSVANKVTVATNFTAAIDTAQEVIGYDGNDAAAAARALLQGVTSTTNPVTYQASVDAVLDQLANPPVPVVNTALTTGVDVLTGTTGNDNFNSTLTFSGSISATSTLNAGDIINGGVGTDSLNVTVSGSSLGGAYIATPTLTNVEKVLVANSESDATNNVTIDLSLADSALTTVGTTSSTTVDSDTTFANIGKKVDVVMAGRGDLTVGFGSNVNTGTADALNLTVNGTGVTGTNATFDTEDGVETLNITSATAANNLTLGGIANLATVTVTGAKDIALNVNGAANTNVKTIDASAATGKVTVDASGLTLSAITVKGGSGTTDVFATDKDVTASSALKNVTGFETLALNKAGGTQTVSLDAAIAGVSTIDLSAADKQTLTLATGYTGATTVNVGSTGAVDSITNQANVALTVAGSAAAFNAATIAGGTGTDVLKVTADGTAAVSLASVSGVETITIAANATDSSKVVDLTVGGVNTVVASGKTLSIDASALTNSSATLKFVGTGEVNGHFSITGGAGNDSITGGDGGDTIVSGAGADSITAGAGVDSISTGEGNDTINMGGNLTSDDTIDGGAGTDTLIVDSVGTNAFAHVTNIENVKFSASATSVTLAAPLTTSTVTLDLSDAAAQSLTLAAGYTGATTVKVGTGDTIVNTAGVALSVTGTTAAFNNATITGGTGTDALTITANSTATANIVGVTGVETITVAASSTLGQGVTLQGIKGSAAGKTTTIDASALTDTTAAFGISTVSAVANSGLSIKGAAGANTIDWSGSAANVTVVGGGSADVLTAGTGIDSISAGAGNDTIVVGTSLTFDDTIDGGAGTDVLETSLTTIGSAGEFAHVSNIETLKLTGTSANATIGASTPAFSTFDLTTATKQTLVIAPGFASAVTVNITGTGSTNGDAVTNNANVALTVNGKVADFTATTVTGGTGVDTLNITADSSSTVTLTNVTGVEQINVKGATGKSADIALVAGNVASGKTLTIDASSFADSTVGLTLNGSAIIDAASSLNVTGSLGSDSLVGGAGVDTINGGAGADYIDSKAGNDSITGGTGNDVFVVNANSNKLTFATVTDFAAGDALKFSFAGTPSTTVPSKLVLNAAATLSDYIDAAASGNANTLAWFQFGGNTYVVGDKTNTATTPGFVAGTDTIIQLNGLIDLSDSNIQISGTNAYWQLGSATPLTAPTGALSLTDGGGAGVNFIGGASADTFAFAGNLTSADTVQGGLGNDTISVSGTVADAAFTKVSSVEILSLAASTNLTLGTLGVAAGIRSITATGTAVTVDASAAVADLSIVANGGANTINMGANLTAADTITGAAGTDTLKVSGTVADAAFTKVTSVETLDLTAASTITLGALAAAAGITAVTTSGTAAVTVDTSAATAVVAITGGAGDDTITGSTAAQTITGGNGADTISGAGGIDSIVGGAGNDLIIVNSATDDATGIAYDGGADTDTLRVTGTTALNLSNDTLTSIDVLDLNTDTGVQSVTLTAAQRTGITTINAGATDIISLTTLTGATVAATGAIDKFVFGASDTGVIINGFTSGTDKLNVDAYTTETALTTVTGTLTNTAAKFYFLAGQSAGAADGAAAAATAISAAATWTDANATSYVVIVDNNSTGIFQWVDTAASGDEAATAELTLIATINSTTVAGDFLFA